MSKIILSIIFIASLFFVIHMQREETLPISKNEVTHISLTETEVASIQETFEYLIFLRDNYQKVENLIYNKQFEQALIMSFEGIPKDEIMAKISNQYTLEDLELPKHGICDIVFLVKSNGSSISCDFPKFGKIELTKSKQADQVAVWSCRNNTIFSIEDLTC